MLKLVVDLQSELRNECFNAIRKVDSKQSDSERVKACRYVLVCIVIYVKRLTIKKLSYK